MVMARLHIICGNCGSNAHLRHEIERDSVDLGDKTVDDCYIWCENCGTLHSIHEIMPPKEHDNE